MIDFWQLYEPNELRADSLNLFYSIFTQEISGNIDGTM